jgi:xylulokinase
VRALSFAGQMLSLVPLDAGGRPTRPAISWLDGRAGREAARITRRLGGRAVVSLLAGAVPTGKDIVAKVAWLARNEPAVHARTRAYCDATGFLVARATGRLIADPTAVGATGVLDTRTRSWSVPLAWLTGFPLAKAPEVLPCASIAGALRAEAARACGLAQGTAVAAGMADIAAAALGAGAVAPGDAHVYLGTSAWIGVTTARPRSAPRAGIASVPAADGTSFLAIGETETAGACRDWLARALGTDALDALVASVAPGSEGLLFLPWLFGERSPVSDVALRGGFVNLALAHGRAHLARAVYEGVALNLRWILDELARAGEPAPTLRAIGGGARSDAWLQIVADVTGRPVERVAHPQQAGAIGAALLGAVAAGALRDVVAIKRVVRVDARFVPRAEHAAVYARASRAFRALYPPLARAARTLGGAR